jgi:hypothetical protein
MNGNSKGGYRTTAEAMMKAYDKLPAAARRALADAVGNWAPQPYLTRYRRGAFKTGSEIAWDVRCADIELLNKFEEQRRLAVGAYKGNAPEKPMGARQSICGYVDEDTAL